MRVNKVLIIDNDEVFLFILKNAFESKGYSVIVTTDSMQAMGLFDLHHPCVVLLNVFMPYKDGFEVLKEMKLHYPHSYVIAISTNERYLRAIKLLGANKTIHKLCLPSEIVDEIGCLSTEED